MWRSALVASALATGLLVGGGTAVAGGSPSLRAEGPTSVTGTEATGVFTVGRRTVRQVRYADGGTLTYTFSLHNDNSVPVRVVGAAEHQAPSRLFTVIDVSSAWIWPDGSARVTVLLRMDACETLSSRAGGTVSEVWLRARRVGVFEHHARVVLPEELHTGSPREASCPSSTARSRPQG